MLSAAVAAVCPHHSASSRRCGRHGITIAVLQGLSFCDSYERCFYVRACVRVMLACHPEHNEDQFQPAPPLNFKKASQQYNVAAVQQQQQQQQRYNTSEPRNAHHIHRKACVPHSACNTPGIKPTTSRRVPLYHSLPKYRGKIDSILMYSLYISRVACAYKIHSNFLFDSQPLSILCAGKRF